MPNRNVQRVLWLLALLAVACLWWWAESSTSDSSDTPSSTQSSSPSSTGSTTGNPSSDSSNDRQADTDGLPPEVDETLELVDQGGPFPYDRDGVTFENREGLLPDRQRGYYREYTVPTPGEDDRGARRLVVGEAGEVYYTADHYQSFTQIRDGS